jgi:hypothetical protein
MSEILDGLVGLVVGRIGLICGPVVTLTDHRNARLFYPGQKIVIETNVDRDVRPGGPLTVSSVDARLGTVTFTSDVVAVVATACADDLLVAADHRVRVARCTWCNKLIESEEDLATSTKGYLYHHECLGTHSRRLSALGAEPVDASESGRKHDTGKVRWSLVPWMAMHEVAEVLEFGAKLYGDHNWRKVANGRRRYLDAAMRHVIAALRGETADADSGKDPLAHAVASLLFAMSFEPEKSQ